MGGPGPSNASSPSGVPPRQQHVPLSKYTCTCMEGFPQSMLNELNSILHELTSTTIVHGVWRNFKIYKKSDFVQNPLKVSTQHKYMYVYQKKL